MTGNAINAKSKALELHELSSEDLDAVAGGDINNQNAQAQAQREEEDRNAAKGAMTFQQLLAQ